MSLLSIRDGLAATLGVEEPRRPALWVLRLFVLPPDIAAECRSDTPQSMGCPSEAPLLRRLLLTVAAELGVRQPASPTAWLQRLFLAPPKRARLAADSRAAPTSNTTTRCLSAWIGLWGRVAMLALRLVAPVERAVGIGLERAGQVMASTATAVRAMTVIVATAVLVLTVTTPLDTGEQAWFFGAMLATALLLRRLPGPLPNLLLIALALITGLRYAYWRLGTTLVFESSAGWVCGMLLLAAEIYTWVILILGFLQTAMPLRRPPVALPEDASTWPSVDVMIPTYNEPLRVVRAAVLAAKSMDWPSDRLKVYLLDDGRREEFRAFADEAGIGYLTRTDNTHAKAGNLNRALTVTQGEFIAIFDCDHIPTRSFLQLTMGWLIRDPQCALIQTPHHFFSADPFERNLNTFGRVPAQSELFHRLIQDGNDLWNAAFFAGSCAVIRRAPLEEIDGIAVQTVTEDAHTALKLHRRGYNSAYLNIPQAAGLATESLAAHIGQQIRWARGMTQIFRIDNPFRGQGLTLFQRLCYANAMIHFLHGLPRLIFLTAPLSYLFFELHIIHAEALTLASYVTPYLIHTVIANGKIQGAFRHSVWPTVYESVLSWYITLPTLLALINPKLGKFNVTPKGDRREEPTFDWHIARPLLFILFLNVLGFGLGWVRLFFWNADESGVVILNLIWTTLNLIVLGTAVGAAREARQIRTTHRVAIRVPATLCLADGRSIYCRLGDYSFGGLRVQVLRPEAFTKDQFLFVSLQHADQEFSLPARVASVRGTSVGLKFDNLSLEDEARLVQCTFARADAWRDPDLDVPDGPPTRGLREVIALSVSGFAALWSGVAETCRRPWFSRRNVARA